MTRRTSAWIAALLLPVVAGSAYGQGKLTPTPEVERDARTPAVRVPPGVCKLSGAVEGDYASLQAHYIFETAAPATWVVLGLQGVYLSDEGKLDKQLPLLKVVDGGIEVRVDEAAREHHLQLNFRVPIKVRRSGTASANVERSLEFGLPGAAVTLLSLSLPPGVKELRANDNLETRRQAGRWDLALGPIDKLRLSWKEALALPGKEALLTCDSAITVAVDDAQVETNAVLLLEDQRGQAKEWQLLLPEHIEDIKIKTASGVPPEVIGPDGKNPFHILRFIDPSRERIEVHVREVRTLEEGGMTVGPFYVLGANKQGGVITVKKSPSALLGKRLDFQRRPHVFGKNPSNQPDVLAEFQYSKLPLANKAAPTDKLRRELALLDFVVKQDRGQYETHVEHEVRLHPGVDGWLITSVTKIKVKSQSGLAGFVDVQLPRGEPASGLGVLAGPAAAFPASVSWLPMVYASRRYWPMTAPAEFTCEQIDGPKPTQTHDERQRTRISLAGAPAREFTVALSAAYLLPRDARRVRLQLPTPVGSIERGAQIDVAIDNRYELQATDSISLAATSSRHQHEWEQARTPSELSIAWRPYVPEFHVAAIVDVTIHERYARIREELRFPEIGGLPDDLQPRTPLQFQIPVELKGRPKSFYGYDSETGLASAAFRAGEPLVFEYSVPVPKDVFGQAIPVPLLWPTRTTGIDAKVRVWTPAGTLPRLDDDQPGLTQLWDNVLTEFVAGRDTMPGLVLRGAGSRLPLALRLDEPPEAKVPNVVFDRGLIDVSLKADGEEYLVRFLVKRVNSDSLDIVLPGLATEVVQEMLLDDVELAWGVIDNETIRLQIKPELVSRPAILEIKYKLRREQGGGWQSLLRLPKVRGAVFLNGIRWQIAGPSQTAVFLVNEAAQVDYRWGLVDGWLPTPVAAATRQELEQWLLGPTASAADLPASLVFWRSSLEPLHVWHVPDLTLFAVCSLAFLGLGLGLNFMPLSRYSFWLLVALLGLLVIAAGILWPSLLPVVLFGSQPGVIILLVILTVLWLRHERYRRQLLFLPGFTRRKASSSIVRQAAAAGQQRREASTVDSPASQAMSGASHGT